MTKGENLGEIAYNQFYSLSNSLQTSVLLDPHF